MEAVVGASVPLFDCLLARAAIVASPFT